MRKLLIIFTLVMSFSSFGNEQQSTVNEPTTAQTQYEATSLHDAFVEASYSLTVSITELANPANIIDMGDLNTGLTLSSTGLFNFDLEPSGSKSQMLTGLNAGAYQIGVTHSTYVSAKHVPEPTTLAIFGLGLLGLAGASRRRKS